MFYHHNFYDGDKFWLFDVQHTSAAAIRCAEKQRTAGEWDRAEPSRKFGKNKWRLAALNQRQHGNVKRAFRSDIRR